MKRGLLLVCLRYFVILGLSCALLAYVAASLRKYLAGDLGVSVSVEPRTSFPFPAVAVCGSTEEMLPPGEIRPSAVYAEHDVLVENKKVTVKLHHNGTVSKGPSDTGARWIDILTIANSQYETKPEVILCNIYHPPPNPTPYSAFSKLDILVRDEERPVTSSYYAVLAGHPAVLTTALDILGADYFIVPSKPGINRKLSIRLAFEVYKKLPSASERSCLAPREYDKIPESEQNGRMLRCEMRYFFSSDGASCFARRTANASSPPCTTEELVALSRRKEELLTGGEKKFLDLVGCQSPCDIPVYHMSSQEISDEAPASRGEPGIITLHFVAPSPFITTRKEYLLYDLGSLAGDVGGMLGMLLGASALAFYDHVLGLIRAFSSLKK